MVYKIKFISEEVDGFFREIEIDSDATFLDLSDAILQSCGYSDDQMTSFYVCDDEWDRSQQITREDVTDPSAEDEDLYLMADTPLADFINDKGQRFEYVFDTFTERSFYLQVKDIITNRHLDKAVVVRQHGEPPAQIGEADADLAAIPPLGKKGEPLPDDMDDDFYDDGQFDSEDFDAEGFEISDERPY